MPTLALTHDPINAQGGLPLIGTLIEKFSGLRRAFAADPSRRSDSLSDADILISQLGLLAQGRSHYEDIELFRQPEADTEARAEHFARSLGLPFVPSESILRQRLKVLAKDDASPPSSTLTASRSSAITAPAHSSCRAAPTSPATST